MNEFHTALSLPKNVFNESTSCHDFELTRRTQLIPSLHLNSDILKIIDSVGLYIGLAELFYSPPGMISGIHRDNGSSDISKINWVYQGKDSKMIWYDTDPNKPIIGSVEKKNLYKLYTAEESKLLHEFEIHSPSLVQVAVAHNIINNSEPRWAVSLMLYYKDRYGQCPYNVSLDRLKDYIL